MKIRKTPAAIIFLLTLFLCVPSLRYGETGHIIAGLGKPVGLDVDGEHLYIIENHRVHIYSLKDMSPVKSFGKQGQGPGEFQTLPHVPVTLDCSTGELIVGSIRKISYYSKRGEFKREVKAVNLAYKLVFLDKRNGNPRFLGWSRMSRDHFNFNTIVVFDHKLNKVKQIYEAKDPYQGPGKGYDILTKIFDFKAHKGKIVIPGRDNRSLDFLNYRLEPEFTLTPETTPVPVSTSFRDSLIHNLKTSPETKNAYPLIKPVRFPSHFPLVNRFFTDSGTLYIMTWERSAKGNRFLFYTMNGKFRGEGTLPVQYQSETDPYPMTIRNGKFYQLVENTDAEEWELLVQKLN